MGYVNPLIAFVPRSTVSCDIVERGTNAIGQLYSAYCFALMDQPGFTPEIHQSKI